MTYFLFLIHWTFLHLFIYNPEIYSMNKNSDKYTPVSFLGKGCCCDYIFFYDWWKHA